MKTYQNEMRPLSSYGSYWIVFHANDIPTDVKDVELLRRKAMAEYKKELTLSECLYAISLCNAEDRSTFTPSLQATTSTNGGSTIQVVHSSP